MTMQEAILQRHSVRSYLDKPIPDPILHRIREEIDACNRESGLHIQLVTGEASAFDSRLAHYGSFINVNTYLVFAGPRTPDFAERCGYYGQRLVLLSQMLGLNSCWVALTFSKGAAKRHISLDRGEKMGIVISLGYGQGQGKPHRSKTYEQVTKNAENAPEWFRAGVQSALLAPTAMNQQKFTFTLEGDRVIARAGLGPHAKIDLGIVKYHFEVTTGRKVE